MRQGADNEKREQAFTAANIGTIESKAKKQYEKDLKAAEAARAKQFGSWVSASRFS